MACRDWACGEMVSESRGWSAFFDEMSRLIEQTEQQYGLANRSLTEYIIDRLEYAIIVCSDLCDHMRGVSGLDDYYSSTQELIDCLKVIYRKWEEYEGVLDSILVERPPVVYQTPVSTLRAGPGRPRFDISKEQLEYLSSLSFKWNEIAVLLGVSRMTIYRYVHVGDCLKVTKAQAITEDILTIITRKMISGRASLCSWHQFFSSV